MTKTLPTSKSGIAEFIETNRISHCAMVWNGKTWLIVAGRGNGVVSARGVALQPALREALAILNGKTDDDSDTPRGSGDR